MAQGITKLKKPSKPLADQTEDEKHNAPLSPGDIDEQDFAGDMPNPGIINADDQPDPQDVTNWMNEMGGAHQESREGEGDVNQLDIERDLAEDEEENRQS